MDAKEKLNKIRQDKANEYRDLEQHQTQFSINDRWVMGAGFRDGMIAAHELEVLVQVPEVRKLLDALFQIGDLYKGSQIQGNKLVDYWHNRVSKAALKPWQDVLNGEDNDLD